MQEVNIVAVTKEIVGEYDAKKTNEELTVLSGKAAGVCYMPDDYLEEGIQNVEKALKRAEGNSKSGHHSVYDHGHLTMVIKTNKMMCMILNSLGVYATSEKSARYTKMHPETELELEMYNKWTNRIQELILNKYPDTDDKTLQTKFNKFFASVEGERQAPPSIENGKFLVMAGDKAELFFNKLDELKADETLPSRKLAMENARYMISVFTPTTIEYTISFRQLFLTIDYLYKLETNCDYIMNNHTEAYDENTYEKVKNFLNPLKDSVRELREQFIKVSGQLRIMDNKNQNIRFLEAQHVVDINILDGKRYTLLDKDIKTTLNNVRDGKNQNITDSYTLVYDGSLAMLAQAQRHRTLRYTMMLEWAGQYGFYTPVIVEDAGLKEEWQNDIKSVAYCIPQGTMVRITEQGLFEDFALKCKERMCGRAQLEVMRRTTESVKLFISNKKKLSICNQNLLGSMTVSKEKVNESISDKAFKKIAETITKDEVSLKEQAPCARCEFRDFKCQEGCQWGAKEALTRQI